MILCPPDETLAREGAAVAEHFAGGADQAAVVQGLLAALAAPGANDLGPRIDAALQQWPEDSLLHLLKIRWLERSGADDALRDELARARQLFPFDPRIALRVFRSDIDAGDIASASELLCGAIWPSPLGENLRGAALELLFRSGPADDLAGRTLARLLRGTADDRLVLPRLAALELKRGRIDAALDHLARAEAYGPLSGDANAIRSAALLKSERSDDAFGQHLDQALRRDPDARRLHALKCDFHRRRGETGAAQAALALARARFPDDPWLALRHFEDCLAAQDRAQAARILRDDIWRSSLPQGPRRRALGALVRDWPDRETLGQVLTELLHGGADDRFVLVKLASLAARDRRHLEAVRFIERAERLGSLPAEAAPMRINLLLLSGQHDTSLALAKSLLAANPQRKDLLRRANLIASVAGNQDDVTETITRALTHWPTDASILQRYNRSIIPEEVDRGLFRQIEPHSRSSAVNSRWLYQFAMACLRHTDTPRACSVLRGLSGDPDVGFEARRILGVLETMPAGDWDVAARFSNDSTRDMRVVRVPGARATMVVMAGLHGGLGNLPFTHVDALLRRHPLNVVYLRDNLWSAFTAGVPSLGPEEASTIAALKALCARMGDLPVMTFGGSLAGWSALRYGALMGARAVISLSGPVTLMSGGEQQARFAQHYLTGLVPAETRDLMSLLRQSPSLRIFHVYGELNPKDRANAALLAPLPHATVMPIRGCDDHFIAAHLIASGRFDPLIASAIDDIRPAGAGRVHTSSPIFSASSSGTSSRSRSRPAIE